MSPDHAQAQGRLHDTEPVGIIDIGSNSVRLVVYERLTRSPTVLFNEKVLAGLGRGVGVTNRLAGESVERALFALKRFRFLATQAGAETLYVLATAAAREAENGPDFIREVEKITGAKVEVLSGRDEAERSACGIISGIWRANGIAGDLGGGSLELVDIRGEEIGDGRTYPLGGLRLQDAAEDSVRKAEKIAADTLDGCSLLDGGAGRAFYAIGGTWRSLARLFMFETGYPLKVMHHFAIPAGEALDFCRKVAREDLSGFEHIDVISRSRRALLPYGAAVMEQIIRRAQPTEVVLSALGVREGHLYKLLSKKERARDPLIAASEELAILRARSPKHARELGEWTGRLFEVLEVEESADERRLRTAACLLADIGWRAHPDYRGEQSLNIIAHAAFIGIDHPGRAYLALANFYRHVGLIEEELSPWIRKLATTRLMERARILGSAFRVAYLISAAMPGVMPKTTVRRRNGDLVLELPKEFADLDGERLRKRFSQLGRLMDLSTEVEIV
ncbi:exopolyphosphatase/guanosine-5'-triphosphate,3'-diphosphate pyrophosphatase [Rhodobium orientis]|uniref:Exopolyphosphatase n=1 Tax=Rhodobium orientis TaxID=34017 RepID=A0A327JPC0_9HYPH|nr:Ppx/GppA phosphatase family protein [Rhodobium orientis]MBB4302191.1 exopolyphosphatase/guanosine-5'-triphosphate,3'-diphosphate pyrophosphatase [Rhodobium orientis]MBK5948902.1 exopolyphosphatase [Rhodobium orientis]RAI27911.1 exopolyphosphatase [Rhodobium orientis]